METTTLEGYQYFITFMDDFSCYTHIGFCKSKDEALAVFKAWKAQAKKETGKSLKILHMDGGGEYTSSAFNTFLAENGIKREVTNPYTPQENGVSEWANHTINNLAHSMIANAREVLKAKALPPALWSQAVQHVVWIKNHTLTQSLNSKIIPYQSYFGKPPSLAMLCLFGCKAFVHVLKTDQTKLGECSIESQDVEFEEVEDRGWERISPNLDSSDDDPDMGTDMDKHIDLEDSEGGQKSTLNPQGNDLPAPELSSPSLPILTPILLHRSNSPNKGIPPTQPDEDPKLSLGSRPKTTGTGPSQSRSAPSVGANTSPVDNTEHTALFLTADAPCSYQEAMACSDADGWVEAITEEYNNLK